EWPSLHLHDAQDTQHVLRGPLIDWKGWRYVERELVGDACTRWNLPEAVGPASLVLSELVGNVVRHAGTPMQVTLTLRRPDLQLAVLDGSRVAARMTMPDLRAEGGRGLMLVRELAQRWGSMPAGDGKVVWAVLPAN
ncbi:ATP-binding protein, partial [Micromonospora sp. NPDC049799]|uniref:ATP-binding protein n=1 Tax=Micromonospora sp. NPDC049799 TaxID=3154741 RepID=UPI0034114D40